MILFINEELLLFTMQVVKDTTVASQFHLNQGLQVAGPTTKKGCIFLSPTSEKVFLTGRFNKINSI